MLRAASLGLCLVCGLYAAGPETGPTTRPATQLAAQPATDQTSAFKVVRFASNPIIRPAMLPDKDGNNINGPSLILAPDWLKDHLGKYYLYFADHRGKYIRLAYADKLEGPWTIHRPGTLKLEELEAAAGAKPARNPGHIASPDVHMDEQKKEIRMYFHAQMAGWGHKSGVAVSTDGLHFKPQAQPLGKEYFRVFQWAGQYYSVDRAGGVLRSKDGLSDFVAVRPGNYASLDRIVGSIRHTAMKLEGNTLLLFFSRVGDAPEQILMSRIELTAEPKDWRISKPVKVIEPETEYEGTQFPNKPSSGGPGTNLRQLRDPCIFQEAGKTYLLYSVAGEGGIAMAEITSEARGNL